MEGPSDHMSGGVEYGTYMTYSHRKWRCFYWYIEWKQFRLAIEAYYWKLMNNRSSLRWWNYLWPGKRKLQLLFPCMGRWISWKRLVHQYPTSAGRIDDFNKRLGKYWHDMHLRSCFRGEFTYNGKELQTENIRSFSWLKDWWVEIQALYVWEFSNLMIKIDPIFSPWHSYIQYFGSLVQANEFIHYNYYR